MRLAILCLWMTVQCSHNALSQEKSPDDSCQCVPMFNCNYKTHGAGIITIRVDKENCPNTDDVCCPINSIRQRTVSPSTPPLEYKCGVQYLKDINLRITDKTEAGYGEFPWMTAVLGQGNKFICGGSLIHPQVVLTAAHCVIDVDSTAVTVRLGEWDTQHKSETYPVETRRVVEIVTHEQFMREAVLNDIALLFLDTPVELGGNIGTVCLPMSNADMDERICYASGWGKDGFGENSEHPAILRKVELSTVNRDLCQHQLQGTKLGKFFRLHISFLCAGGEQGQDTCKGDGGGPLVCSKPEDPDVYEQAGIVSWGIDCGTQVPAAYTNIAIFRSWIDLQLLQRGLTV